MKKFNSFLFFKEGVMIIFFRNALFLGNQNLYYYDIIFVKIPFSKYKDQVKDNFGVNIFSTNFDNLYLNFFTFLALPLQY